MFFKNNKVENHIENLAFDKRVNEKLINLQCKNLKKLEPIKLSNGMSLTFDTDNSEETIFICKDTNGLGVIKDPVNVPVNLYKNKQENITGTTMKLIIQSIFDYVEEIRMSYTEVSDLPCVYQVNYKEDK